MNSWTSLPYEILVTIFSHLDCTSDLIQAQLICKSWYQASQARLYRNITIKEGKLSVTKKLIESLKVGNQGRLVKCLDMETYFIKEFIHRQSMVNAFETLISFCPNIRIISALHDASFPFYKIIEKNRDYLQYLQRIPNPIHHNGMEAYFRTALAFQKSLKHLYLGDMVKLSYVSTTSNKVIEEKISFVPHLDKFISLTSLELIATSNKNIFELESIINQCAPSLRTIIYTAFNNTKPVKYHYQHDNSKDNGIQQISNIKTFIGYNVIMTNSVINYIMCKFPSLDHLKIQSFYPNFYVTKSQPRLDISFSMLPILFKYISRLRSFDLFGLLTLDEVLYYVKEFQFHANEKNCHSSSTATTLFKLEYSNDMVCNSYPYIHLMKNPSAQYCDENADIGLSFNREMNIIKTGFLLDFDSSILPHTKIIRQLGSTFKGMKLSMRATQDLYIHKNVIGTTTMNTIFNSNFHVATIHGLNDILFYCHSLTHLSLYDMYLLRNTISINKINISVLNLHIEASVILPETLHQLSFCLPSLKYVTFSSCDILPLDVITGVPTATETIEKCPIIYINMSYTTFESVIWRKPPPENPQQFNCYICVIAVDIKYYFKGDEVSLCVSTYEEFNKVEKELIAKPSSSICLFEIHCTSIHFFTVQFNDQFKIRYQLYKYLATKIPV